MIEAFRANRGKVGGQFAGAPLLLLTSTGAKTGRRRTTRLVYLRDGERLIVFGSSGGAPTHPDWYYNLLRHPRVTVEVGIERFEAEAQVLTGKERDWLYYRQVQLHPEYAMFQARTQRTIPVVALRRIAASACAERSGPPTTCLAGRRIRNAGDQAR